MTQPDVMRTGPLTFSKDYSIFIEEERLDFVLFYDSEFRIGDKIQVIFRKVD